ncbi:DUF72 domain-containing protein [Pseudomonas stutzeri]|uniref:DUF72 domain-containing protein n=1 Tax=Stutzerimonas frequens TaxID=2968969 RepID=UPI0007B808DA|nr:DUF72 domain-containing protein [Stutzerimonas frequens]KZX56736.1 hypothetical protein A3710_21440 [Stutzerimonas frequens]MCD1638261.1 DUF72 domain-containing protein [Stutzerimonas stutzeri]NCT78802.1 DUF72 domain-containing protein [Stutzerimonas stutzeri]
MAGIHIGISGWRYAPWRGDFYPKGLTQKKELRFASRAVSSIEINGSFYSLQTPERYADWYADTPKGFVFSVKGPRYITHVRRLREVDGALANFFASGIFQLKEKLGPILWQFPPSFKFDPALFEAFLRQLPHDTEAALAIARDCEPRMEGRSYLSVDRKRRMRHAVEIRNASFVDPAFVELLRKYQVALVVADTAGKWPHHEDLTSDFVYIRLHGAEELYTSGYTDAALDEWRRRIESWNAGSQPDDARLISSKKPRRRASRQVYCYFDNDVKVRAPYDARQLLHRLGLDEHLQVSPGKLEGAID